MMFGSVEGWLWVQVCGPRLMTWRAIVAAAVLSGSSVALSRAMSRANMYVLVGFALGVFAHVLLDAILKAAADNSDALEAP